MELIGERHEMAPGVVHALETSLVDRDVYIILDDSGSMISRVDDLSSVTTRWDHAREYVCTLAEIAIVHDDDGIDVFTLNRDDHLNITNTNEIRNLFSSPPRGTTPLTAAIERVHTKIRSTQRSSILVVITDGSPNTMMSGSQRLYNDVAGTCSALVELQTTC
jgi:Mg-chelatase subunit ChlD